MTTKTDETCTWHLDDDDMGAWATDCRNMFLISDGTPADNKMAFCCYCGKRLAMDDAGQIERNKS